MEKTFSHPFYLKMNLMESEANIGLSVEEDPKREGFVAFALRVKGEPTNFSLPNWYVKAQVYDKLKEIFEKKEE